MSLLDTIQRTAAAVQGFKRPALVLALLFLLAVLYIVLSSQSHAGDRYLIPCIIGLLWSLSAYAFIINFRSLPPPAEQGAAVLSRLKRRLQRIWYGLLALLFSTATIAVLIVSYRLLATWLRGYGA